MKKKKKKTIPLWLIAVTEMNKNSWSGKVCRIGIIFKEK